MGQQKPFLWMPQLFCYSNSKLLSTPASSRALPAPAVPLTVIYSTWDLHDRVSVLMVSMSLFTQLRCKTTWLFYHLWILKSLTSLYFCCVNIHQLVKDQIISLNLWKQLLWNYLSFSCDLLASPIFKRDFHITIDLFSCSEGTGDIRKEAQVSRRKGHKRQTTLEEGKRHFKQGV